VYVYIDLIVTQVEFRQPDIQGQSIQVANKFSGKIIGEVPVTTKSEFTDLVKKTGQGSEISSDMPAHQRARILAQTSRLIQEKSDDFARLLAQEAGKPWKDATVEVQRVVQTFQFAAELSKHLHGETVPLDATIGSENRLGFFLRDHAFQFPAKSGRPQACSCDCGREFCHT
jgi:acyl-CoA reductase-like NAD-dependent aldehyde dehydrogenase